MITLDEKQREATREEERLYEAVQAFKHHDYTGALFQLQRLEADGYRGASVYIASMYEKGYPGVPQDIEKALEMYHYLADRNDPAAIERLAQIYFMGWHVGRDYQQAFHWYEKLARVGDSRAQFLLGDMYMRGLGVTVDVEAATSWWREAEKNGNINAARNLAIIDLLDGNLRGIPRLLKAICSTAYLKLFDRHNERVASL